MTSEEKKQKIKKLLEQIPMSGPFASISLTKEISELREEIEREQMKARDKERKECHQE